MTNEEQAQWDENERRSRALNAQSHYIPQRIEAEHCPLCGQYWELHFDDVDCTRASRYDCDGDAYRHRDLGIRERWPESDVWACRKRNER